MAEQKAGRLFFPMWWSWLVAGLIAAFAFAYISAFNVVEWTQDTKRLATLGGAALAGALVLSNLLWFFSDRSRGLFQGVFLCLFASSLLGAFLIAREESHRHELALIESIEAARLALRQQAADRAKRTLEELEADRQRLREDPFLQYEGRVSPELLAEMRAVQEAVLAEMRKARDLYEERVSANRVEGPETWLRLRTLDELEEHRARYAEIYEASRSYNDFLDGLRENYEARLEEADFPTPADRYSVAEMERLLQFWEYSGAAEVRRLDTEIAAVALKALDLLRDSWGKWNYDRGSSRIHFENPSTEFQFMQVLNQAQMLTQAQRKEERRLKSKLESDSP